MASEQQYIELYEQARQMIFDHASEAMNAVRDEAYERFVSNGFPSRKVERYKYTDIQKLFEPNYGLNLNRLTIPVRITSASLLPRMEKSLPPFPPPIGNVVSAFLNVCSNPRNFKMLRFTEA